MAQDTLHDLALVLSLAEVFGPPIQPAHLDEVVAAWRLMRPHIDCVRAADLASTDEPAALFRP